MSQSLTRQIEEARSAMIELAKEHPLTSPEVVDASQKLDQLLNNRRKVKVS